MSAERHDRGRVLALTGVPGTGKTAVAEALDERFTVVQARDLAERVDAIEGHDEARGADVVDHERLQAKAREALPDGRVLVEGVLAHHCDPDAVVVLRCDPEVLRERLASRDWPAEKVDENVMAETLDAIVAEVATEPAWEIDTTETQPEEVAAIVEALAEGETSPEGADPVGTADWTDRLVGGPA